MNPYERSIIHLNVADFAVAVERAVDCRLQDRPVIIAPEGATRAAVYDMSQEAYLSGIRKGMALRHAVRRCRDARILPPHPDRYEQAMRALLKRALPYSPFIENGDDDGHLFMDATGTNRLFGPPVDVAWRLRKQIRSDLRLDPIWSVAPNKLVAKVATRLVKPDGEYIVAPGEGIALLAPLPVSLVPGIEHADLMRLREFNLTHAFQVSALSLEQLEDVAGGLGVADVMVSGAVLAVVASNAGGLMSQAQAAMGVSTDGPVASLTADATIAGQISTLEGLGIEVVVGDPSIDGASAEWDAGSRTMTISANTMQQGSGAVLQAMNHEAVHVAQSCKAGGVGTGGVALGIGTSGAAAQALQHEVYEGVSAEEQQMELEAYTLTNQAGAGVAAAVQHCSA